MTQQQTNTIFEDYFNSQYSYNELLGQDGNLQPYWQTFFKSYRALFIIFGLLFLLLITIKGVQTIQDLRKRAATPNGSASIKLNPPTSVFAPGARATITLNATMPSVNVDAFQIVANFSGTVPTDLTFTPVIPDGMQLVANTLANNTFRLRVHLRVRAPKRRHLT